MTIREKLSIFFNRLLDEVEEIDNEQIKQYALLGLLQQVENNMNEVSKLLIGTYPITKTKENEDGSK